MNVVMCPHCGNQRIVTSKVPRDVVVVLPCPACNELVVLFRNKVIALNRQIIESGTFEERKAHIAEIIAEFLEPGMFGLPARPEPDEPPAAYDEEDEEDIEEPAADHPPKDTPITQSEVDRFVRFELKRIDEAEYFRKYFG